MARDVLRHRLVLVPGPLRERLEQTTSSTVIQRVPAPVVPLRGVSASASAPGDPPAPRLAGRPPLGGLLQGDYRSLFAVAASKPPTCARPGRRRRPPIDWNVGPHGHAVCRGTPDREITAWFLLDLSPSVDFGTSTPSARSGRSSSISSTLARLLTRRGAASGPCSMATRSAGRSRPKGGREQILRLIDDLLAQPHVPARRSHLSPLLGTAQRAGAALLVFVCPTSSARPAGAAARPPQSPTRSWRSACSIHGSRLPVRSSHHGGRPDQRAALRRHPRPALPAAIRGGGPAAEEMTAAFRRSGVEAASLSTDEDLVRAIVRMATLRRQRRPAHG